MAQPRRQALKIVLLGDSGVGKTSLMNQYLSNKFTSQYKTTIGADFINKETAIDGKLATLQIWDTAGQERFQSLGAAFYRGADCCCLVFDVNNPKSFDSLEAWQEEFIIQAAPDPSAGPFPVVVLGNKVDNEERAVSKRQAQTWCEERNFAYFETSARDGTNVEQAFLTIARLASKRSKKDLDVDLFAEHATLKLMPQAEPAPAPASNCNC